MKQSASGSGKPAARLADLWLAGLGLGLLTGLLEFVWLAAVALSGSSDRLGPDLVWMAPVSNLLWSLPVTSILAFASARWRFSLGSAVGVLVGLTVTGVLLATARIHPVAALLLGTGVGVQVVRVAERKPKRLPLLMRGLALGSVTAVVVGGVAERLVVLSQERRELAALPDPRSRWNVLLLVLDTVRATELSLYGFGRATTPALERWAADGVVFERAIATAPWTLPSHASLFTGRWAHELSTARHRALDRTHPTLAETLWGEGYLTAGFVANLAFCGRDSGLARGFIHYEDNPVSAGEVVVSSALGRTVTNFARLRRLLGAHEMLGRKSAEQLQQAFLSWVEHHPGRPFFAFINYFEAHQPYLPPGPFVGRFASGSPVPRVGVYRYRAHDVGLDPAYRYTATDLAAEREAYQESIAYLDAQLDQLLRELARRSLLDRTLVIVTSDHGEQFGEHGLHNHANSVYTQLLHVPLILRLPGKVPAGLRVPTAVSLRDLPATVLDVLGLGASARYPGRSLTRFWNGATAGDGPAPTPILSQLDWPRSSHRSIRSIILEPYHYIHMTNGRERLYNLAVDPEEDRDLRDSTAERPALAHARALLDSLAPSPPRGPRQ